MSGALFPAVIAAAALVSASCAAPLTKLPSGPGAPAPDPREAIEVATSACRRVSTLTLEIAVRGSIGGRRARIRLSAGLARPASMRLEAVAPFGQPIFILVANEDAATLLLLRDQRVLEHGRPDAVLEAIAGVPLDASALRAVVTGCAVAPDPARARALGETWRVAPDGADEVYLRREGTAAPWRLVATVHRASGAGWRAEYRDFETGLPRSIRLVSALAGRFDVQLTLSQLDVNTPLDANAFTVRIPRTAQPISLEELRQSGPFSANGR
jgi:outer membrane lipoprotein-sorting protein